MYHSVSKYVRRVTSRITGRDTYLAYELGSDHYDRVYAGSKSYRVSYETSEYYSIWTVIVDRIRLAGNAPVLEIGCGSGQLAELLRDQGTTEYLGFDYSSTAIDLARERGLDENWFRVADAFDTDLYETTKYETVICTEVLEHVDDDLDIISSIRPGTRCLCTVPNFPYDGHVRHFSSEAEVIERYARYFDDFDVFPIRGVGRPDLVFYLFDGRRNEYGHGSAE